MYLWNVVEFPAGTQNLAKQVYERLQEKLLKGLNYETVDPQPLGDIKRLSRVPYTLHEETGQLCVPITLSHQPLVVFSLEGFRKHGVQKDFFKQVYNEVATSIKTNKSINVRHILTKFNGKIRPCIKAALTQHLETAAGHGIRLAIATEFLHAGHKPEDIAVLFQNQSDYSFQKSLFYVEDAMKRGYKPYKCKTIKSYGFCLGENCHFFKKLGEVQ